MVARISSLKEKLNFFNEFKEFYFQIVKDFKYDYERDLRARDYLSQLLIKKNQNWSLETILDSFKTLLSSKPVILIYGCGPTFDITVDKIIKKMGRIFFNNFINLVANGASIFLRKRKIRIDAIFTDLDGITKKEFKYSNYNIVHAHGDNISKLKLFRKHILRFHNIIGTTQAEPLENVINPGGFTDGDRILYFIHKLTKPSQKIFLIGMDFHNIVGRYSKLDMKNNQEASMVKKKKLQYGIKLLEWILPKLRNETFFVNSKNISEKFHYISVREFLDLL